MILTTSYKSNHLLWLGFKLIIALGCLYFIIEKIYYNPDISFYQFKTNIQVFKIFSFKNVFILSIISFLNWFFEIWKWKILGSNLSVLSWKEASKQSLSSLTFSLFTPIKIGEYGAKAYFFDKKNWKKVFVLNALGNWYQLLATVFFGFFGIIYFYDKIEFYILKINYKSAILLFFLLVLIISISSRIKQLKKIIFYLKTFSSLFHLKIIGFSFVRYLLFSHQFFFILYLFFPLISYIDTICIIYTIYMVSSFIPMLSILDVVVKGTLSIVFLSWININPTVALCASFIMWIFNFAFPSIIGSFYILRLQPKWK